MFPTEHIFKNNQNLFKILLDEKIWSYEFPNKSNVIGYYNCNNILKSTVQHDYSKKDKQVIKSKLLFHEYKLNNLHKSKNTITVIINGEEIVCSEHIITFGRKNYGYNTFSMFDDSEVSRRHFVVLNQKNSVWLYDQSTLGTYVDGKKVNRKAFLLGRCEVEFGNQKIYVKSNIDLLL